jgi:hypothetical protein
MRKGYQHSARERTVFFSRDVEHDIEIMMRCGGTEWEYMTKEKPTGDSVYGWVNESENKKPTLKRRSHIGP